MKLKYSVIAVGLSIAYATLPAMADNSTATVDQYGSANTTSIEQNNANGSDAKIYQHGSNNSAGNINAVPAEEIEGIQQLNTRYAVAEILQYGTYNDSQIYQSGGDHNTGKVKQDGNHNFGDIKQIDATDSVAYIYQKGDRNDADINQTGASHQASVSQQGNDNNAETNQLGSNNFAQTVQTGNFSTATIEQEAGSSYNRAYITQHGTGWDNGSRNIALITQGNTGHVANINQNGWGNNSSISQH
jgi:hypothetical protein